MYETRDNHRRHEPPSSRCLEKVVPRTSFFASIPKRALTWLMKNEEWFFLSSSYLELNILANFDANVFFLYFPSKSSLRVSSLPWPDKKKAQESP